MEIELGQVHALRQAHGPGRLCVQPLGMLQLQTAHADKNMFALADSGAQMAVMGPTHAVMVGIKEYVPTKMTT